MNTTRHFTRSLVFFSAWIVLAAVSALAADKPKAVTEKDLLATLASDAAKGEKAIACKQLAIHGSAQAVPELAKLLPDADLHSWARIALEAIPGKEADEALRKAADSLDGLLLVGTINSIGVRRDAGAVDGLAKHLQNNDAEVASAAAVALGRIGTPAAESPLRKALAGAPDKVRSSVAEGCILIAEKRLAEGKDAEAAKIYDEVRKADVHRQKKLEAMRGSILARKQEGIPLLVEQLKSSDKTMFNLALGTAREFPGGEVDAVLVKEMNGAKPERAALILQAMADRPKTVVLSAVLSAAGKGPKEVRLAAIDALGRVGDDSCFAPLLKMALESDADMVDSVKKTLAILPGATVDSNIVAQLQKSEGKQYVLLIELVGERRISAVPDLLKALNHSDPAVRAAAFTSLGETVSLQQLPALVSEVVSPKHPEDRTVAQQALKAASIRMADREACASQLDAAIEQSSSVPTKIALLEILGSMGGTNALRSVGAAARSNDAQLQDIASRLLGEWMTEDAAPVLLELAKAGPEQKYQGRALRGYVRIARQFDLPEERRVEMCRKAIEACRQPAEQKLVLEVLKRYPSMETLKLAIKSIQVPEIKDEAEQVTLAIAQRMGSMSLRANPFYLPPRPRAEVLAERDQVGELLSQVQLGKVNLEIVKAEYGNAVGQKDVTKVLQDIERDLPVVFLSSPSYTASFGSDSLPEGDKQLKITYTMNGKKGEATFIDDALIVLLQPK